LNGEEVHIDLPLEVDEVDGSWNWIYFGYSHGSGKVSAALKGSKSDLKTKLVSNIAHASP
jgi:hypothetical protein